MGFIGIIFLLVVAYLFSNNRRKINLRTVLPAFLLQSFIAFFVLYSSLGRDFLLKVSTYISTAINAGKVGVEFIFGSLATGSSGFIFAIYVLPLIIFFSALISVLYYLKIMPLIINSLGYILHKLLNTSKVESLSSTANIFVGQTEAPITIKPYLNNLTTSELFTVMVGGLASVAGAVIAGYAGLGVDLKYLIAASFMAAPGGILMSKIIYPETQAYNHQVSEENNEEDTKVDSIIEAAFIGASTGLKLSLSVGAMLIAFIGLITLFNYILEGLGDLFGYNNITLELILGYIFSPISFLIGVPWEDSIKAGSYIGQKLVTNEFVAYISFTKDFASLSEKTKVIITFALCGFANFSSVGILIGGLGILAKKRRKEIANLGIKAIVAGSLSNLMSATIAGIIYSFS
jgi:CNT family concentrative nucleoside transporter